MDAADGFGGGSSVDVGKVDSGRIRNGCGVLVGGMKSKMFVAVSVVATTVDTVVLPVSLNRCDYSVLNFCGN